MRPPRALLRTQLEQVLRSESDFDAFCLDYFPDVYRRFSSGMDRVRKTNILFEQKEPAEIESALTGHLSSHPEARPAAVSSAPPRASAPPLSSPSAGRAPAPTVPTGAAPVVDTALEEVRDRYRAGRLVIFAGAGISMAAGLPSWGGLVQALLSHSRVRQASQDAQDEIKNQLAGGRFIDALSAIEECLGPQEFATHVERLLDDGRIANVPDIAKAIAELAPKLHAVLTTNLDRLLERAFNGRWNAFSRATADVAQREHVILKLHGTLHERSTWILTRAQYDRAIHADPLLTQALSALFHTHTLLFVGYGLADDDLELVLGWVRTFSQGNAPRHFALLSEGKLGPQRKRQVEGAGIRIIEYPAPGGNHDEVARLLRSLQ